MNKATITIEVDTVLGEGDNDADAAAAVVEQAINAGRYFKGEAKAVSCKIEKGAPDDLDDVEEVGGTVDFSGAGGLMYPIRLWNLTDSDKDSESAIWLDAAEARQVASWLLEVAELVENHQADD